MSPIPSPLLAIDQNRGTVVDRIVGAWGDALAQANAGISAEQLRELLLGMRADQLLAASLAGTLDGLRNVVSAALVMDASVAPLRLQAKTLGDTNQDVVYVPVTPCRLVETRGTFAAVYQGSGPFIANEIRTYTVEGGNGVCLTQLPASITPGAVQLQVFGIPTTTASGDIEILPQGGTFGSTATMVYLGNNAFTSAAATSFVNVGNKQISVQVRGGGAHLAIDVVGYFRAPQGGYVSGVTAGTGLTGGTITTSGTIAADTTYLQRRVSGTCSAGSSIRAIAADGTVTCESDDLGAGTVTSLSQGTGITLSSNPITTTGSIAADTSYLQRRVSSSCSVGSSIRAIAADGTVTCQTDSTGPANAFVQNGNAFGATAVLGTTDNNALDVRANNSRVMRYEPNAISPNVIGGHPANYLAVGVRGATIAGGGSASGDVDPDFTFEGSNQVRDHYGTVGGGLANIAGSGGADPTDGAFATVSGGHSNFATGFFSIIGGGYANSAPGHGSIVGGGNANTTEGTYSGVASGQINQTPGHGGFVGGGAANQATNIYATVPGGSYNIASGVLSLAAGNESEARGDYSMALGRRAKTFVGSNNGKGAFVWADSNDFDFSEAVDNRFSVRATGGVRLVSGIDAAGVPDAGVVLSSGGGAWASISDRAAKRDLAQADGSAVLAKLVAMPVYTWRYRAEASGALHLGPVAQDFHAAFGLGDSNERIVTVDADGVALAAIQGLHAKLEAQAREIADLKRAMELLLATRAAEPRVAAVE